MNWILDLCFSTCFLTSVITLISLNVSAQSSTPPSLKFSNPASYQFSNQSQDLMIYALGAGDFNGDGLLDLAVCDRSSGFVAVLPNLGSAKFGQSIISTEIYGYDGAVADFNGDGFADLVTAANGAFSVYLNNHLGSGTGTLKTSSSTLIEGDIGTSITAGDFFGDGKTHAAMLSGDPWSARRRIHLFKSIGDGSFVMADRFPSGYDSYAIASGDLNNDGRADAVVTNSSFWTGQTLTVYLANTDGKLDPVADFKVSGGTPKVSFVDFDEDGLVDIVRPAHGGKVLYWDKNKGGASFESEKVFGPTLSQIILGELTVTDLENDGHKDYLAKQVGQITILHGIGEGQFTDPVVIPTLPGKRVTWVIARDFDGDGAVDLAFTHEGHSSVQILRNLTPQQSGKILKIAGTKKGGNTGPVTTSVLDSEASESNSISLVGPSGTLILGTNVFQDNNNKQLISVTFDLKGATPGVYDLRITNAEAQSRTLTGAFTVESGGQSDLWVGVLGHSVIRAGRDQRYFLEYGNGGSVDARMKKVWIRVPELTTMKEQPPFNAISMGSSGGQRYFAFEIPLIRAFSSGTLPVQLRIADTVENRNAEIEIEVWLEGDNF